MRPGAAILTNSSEFTARPQSPHARHGPADLLLFPIDALGALRLRGQLRTTLRAAGLQDLAAALGCHAGAEPVRALAAPLARLKCSLRHDPFTPEMVDSQKDVRPKLRRTYILLPIASGLIITELLHPVN